MGAEGAEQPALPVPDIVVRDERPDDRRAIRHVNQEAFGRAEEADLVDALRASNNVVLSLVGERDDTLVGHILFSPVSVHTPSGTRPSVGLAPMAVLPAWQRKGIGALLVKTSLERLREGGHGSVVVLGHPWYYPRFGFRPAAAWNLRWEHPCPPEAFMALELHPGALKGSGGIVRFRPEFEGV